jgi:hypothetical protein
VAYPAALLRRFLGWHDGRESCEFPPVSPTLDRLLRTLGKVEVALPPLLRPPLGTSVTLLARRASG